MTPQEILTSKVKERFGIEITEKDLNFVNLDEEIANKLEAKNYPSFTLFW